MKIGANVLYNENEFIYSIFTYGSRVRVSVSEPGFGRKNVRILLAFLRNRVKLFRKRSIGTYTLPPI